MANFLEYNPEQAYLLPPTVRAVLGEGHLCFFARATFRIDQIHTKALDFAGYTNEP